jgi:hypothetical protein
LRHALRFGLAALALAAAFLGAACSLLLDTSAEQCTTTADCVARGGDFAAMQCVDRVCVPSSGDAGPWGCLGDVTAPQPGSGNVQVVVPLVDLSTQKPVTAADVSAVVCAKIDVNCSSPLATTQPDASGLLHLTIPAGFDGYVLIEPVLPVGPDGGASDGGASDGGASDAGEAGLPDIFVPSIVFFNPPIETDTTYAVIVLVRTSELGNIAGIEGTTLDPSLGAVFMQTEDCNGAAAAGVSVALDSTTASTQGFYFKGGLPALNAPSTDVTGYAGFVNAPLGSRTVTGTVAATTQRIGTATVFTRPSTISYTVLAPSP